MAPPFSVNPRGVRWPLARPSACTSQTSERTAFRELAPQSVTTSVPSSLLVIRPPEWAAGWSCLYVHFLPLACSCLSVFQPKQLPEVGEEGGEPVRPVLKAALLGLFWLVSVAGLED